MPCSDVRMGLCFLNFFRSFLIKQKEQKENLKLDLLFYEKANYKNSAFNSLLLLLKPKVTKALLFYKEIASSLSFRSITVNSC